MPDQARNLIKQTITNTPGTAGDLTLGAAVSGWLALVSGDNALTFSVTIYASDSDTAAKEVRTGCTYTHSGTSLSRGTLESGTAINLTSSAIVCVTATAASGRRWDAAALSQVTGTDASTTMEVNTLYVVDMSAWATADRTYTLPATAAVGDRVGIMVSAGDATHELLITAASGDTLNAVAGGTEWSRLFITGEVIIARCVAANATWIVEYDGRIPQYAAMYLSTSADGETANTYTLPTAAATPGAWTADFDNASVCSTSNSRLVPRRAGKYAIICAYVPKDAGTTGYSFNLEIRINGTTVVGGPSTVVQAVAVNRITAAIQASISTAGDYFDYYYRTQDGNIGANGTTTWATRFGLLEVLT